MGMFDGVLGKKEEVVGIESVASSSAPVAAPEEKPRKARKKKIVKKLEVAVSKKVRKSLAILAAAQGVSLKKFIRKHVEALANAAPKEVSAQ